MTFLFHLAASSDLFSMGNNLATKIGHLAVAFLAIFVGGMAAMHIGREHHGAAIVVVLIALIPAFFLANGATAVNDLVNTIQNL